MVVNKSLQDQIMIYSFETKDLFTDKEKAISDTIDKLSHEKMKLRMETGFINDAEAGNVTREKFETNYRALYGVRKGESIYDDYGNRKTEISARIKQINEQLPKLKADLRIAFTTNTEVRRVREDAIIDGNIISVFESTMTRTLGMETNGLYKEIAVIRAFYYDVLEDIMLNGFLWGDDKYVCLTASAGQIRTKKVVFIKESVWVDVSPRIMCGLSVEEINRRGGVNCNKFLAYLALANSATNYWKDFDIYKTIVVEDFEAPARGVVDFIDDKTYTTERKEMDVPITHTDGCGMMLPKVSKKNMMVRLPWVKGLLAVFPFDKFIREANEREPEKNHSIVKDIYGKEHDVLAEGIDIIFTKSQFKMWKYYDSWEDYQQKFVSLGCMAGTCNEEEDYMPDARINYQMLQTLTDMSEDEMRRLAERTNERIKKIASSKDSMLAVFGAANMEREMNGFQKCLQYYPELLSDEYTRNTLKQIKKRLVKNARAGKLEIQGKYLFLIPDLYAFCEWLFLGIDQPEGLLKDGEVYCKPYKDFEKLDCLRSPHLYREHAVRRNVIDKEKDRWFTRRAIYTSCHDLISKILQFDNDGDKSLVVAEPLLVEIAERNCAGIVPLFYSMAKAGAVHIDSRQIYDGMIAAYAGGKIGQVSNNITKIWNSENVNLDAIKLLCMENNFTIDYAKTLYKPTRPEHVNKMISAYTKKKTPHFFIYAKDKTDGACEPKNQSVVNMLEDIIENKRMCFTAQDIGKFDYRDMMADPDQYVDPAVVERFIEMDGSSYRQISASCNDGDVDYGYLKYSILAEMAIIAGSAEKACDMLVKYLFTRKTVAHKSTFWLCFGDMVLENLKKNVPADVVQCARCGKRMRRAAPNQMYCPKCVLGIYVPKGDHVRKCVDCGEEFPVGAFSSRRVRCEDCQRIHRKAGKAASRKRRKAA